jgi:hypothetical protein
MTFAYLIYITVMLLVTVGVGRSLFKNGRPFLVDAFGDESLADSVNHFLLVGFYLVNFSLVAFALQIGGRANMTIDIIELLGSKIGSALLVLGVMHLLNLFTFTMWHRFRTARKSRLSPPKPATK